MCQLAKCNFGMLRCILLHINSVWHEVLFRHVNVIGSAIQYEYMIESHSQPYLAICIEIQNRIGHWKINSELILTLHLIVNLLQSHRLTCQLFSHKWFCNTQKLTANKSLKLVRTLSKLSWKGKSIPILTANLSIITRGGSWLQKRVGEQGAKHPPLIFPQKMKLVHSYIIWKLKYTFVKFTWNFEKLNGYFSNRIKNIWNRAGVFPPNRDF